MPAAVPKGRVAAVRRINRFYTRRIGILGERMLDSPFSLTEARVLYELANRTDLTASQLCSALGLDAGYLSRLLARFARAGLIRRTPSEDDARRRHIALTAKGRKVYAPLDRQSEQNVAALLAALPARSQRDTIDAMGVIERVLGDGNEPQSRSYVLRPPNPGDLGWVVSRHGALYAQEYGFTPEFEGLVAGIVADFAKNFDPSCEHCWIAERDGENAGSVFLVRGGGTTAKLRLLLVEPSARGLGIGVALVAECIAFARAKGYREITLWTQSNLTAARHIYQSAGFTLKRTEPHRSFGQSLVGEIWALPL